jgi:hypothetical protein
MAETEALLARIADLEHRLGMVEDREAIERLQNNWGYLIDNRMFDQMVGLFCDDTPSIEIGRRGTYVGKDRIHRFLLEVLGGGRWGLLKNEIINHMQLQLVVTVDPGRETAKARARALIHGDSPPGGKTMLWAEGLYENDYVKEGGAWKIKRIWWVPNFYFQVPGFDSAVYQTGPVSEEFPPDRPSVPGDAALGRGFPPFHYPHPVTGEALPTSPASKREE